MASETRRPGFRAGLWLGLIAGAIAGILVAEVAPMLRPNPWIEAGGQWVRLPSQTPAGPLPQTFTTPAKAWDYGATTRALPSSVTAKAPVIVRVEVANVSGPVGISLAKPDGSALISKEKAVPAGAGSVRIYFRQPSPAEIAVLVRNYNGEGKAGAVTVKDVRYALEASLSKKAMGVVNQAGLN